MPSALEKRSRPWTWSWVVDRHVAFCHHPVARVARAGELTTPRRSSAVVAEVWSSDEQEDR